MTPHRSVDPFLWLPAGLLWSLSLVSLFSLSRGLSYPAELTLRQAVAGLLGLLLGLVLARARVQTLQRLAPWSALVCAVALLAVFRFGLTLNGAQRWLDLGPLGTFQPSEPTKLAVILTLAWLLAGPLRAHCSQMYAWAVGLLSLLCLLIARQPDLGTALVLAASGGLLLFLGGAPWWPLVAGIAATLLLIPSRLSPYQQDRIRTFLDPSTDPTGAGWNLEQSKIAIGSGGFWGRGAFRGLQGPLDFLPEAHSDFLFAVLAEELGFLGCLLVVLLLTIIVGRLFWRAGQTEDTFRRLLLLGVGVHLALHAFLNIAMTVGLAPVTGSPLPFVSFGGSALLTNFLALGASQCCIWAERPRQLSWSAQETNRKLNLEISG